MRAISQEIGTPLGQAIRSSTGLRAVPGERGARRRTLRSCSWPAKAASIAS